MEKVLDFLKELRKNNNKEWFDEHKDDYLKIRQQLDNFVERLIKGICTFDESIIGVTVKDSSFRINRDVRFSHNKEPYKTHIGYHICRGGKNSGYGGYYFHIEPKHDGGFIGFPLLASGLYCPEPTELKAVRDSISEDGKGFLNAIESAKGFKLNDDEMLKRVPKGFAIDNPMAQYLKYKHYFLTQNIPDEVIFNEELLLEHSLKAFKKTYPFILYINNSIDAVK